MSPIVKVTKLDMPLYDEIERLRKENAAQAALLETSWPKVPSKVIADLEAKLAKAHEALRSLVSMIEIHNCTPSRDDPDWPIGTEDFYTLEDAIAVLEELEKK